MDSNKAMRYVAYFFNIVSVVSCLFLKVPQIIFLMEKRNSKGLYVQAIFLEMTALTIASLFNYTNHNSVKSYFEYPVILLQTYVLLFYALVYEGLLFHPYVLFGIFTYLAATFGFIIGTIPKDIIPSLFQLYTPLNILAKLAYIYGIFQEGNSNAVSLTTWYISIFVNIVRLLTVFLVSRDVKMLASFAISTLLSTAVLVTAKSFKK